MHEEIGYDQLDDKGKKNFHYWNYATHLRNLSNTSYLDTGRIGDIKAGLKYHWDKYLGFKRKLEKGGK